MLIMACFGLIICSRQHGGSFDQEGDAMYVVFRQAGITAMGLAVALILAVAIPLKLFDHFWMSAILYVITSGLLVYVKLFGVVINSARRWIRIPVFGTFQPSELAKLAMVFCFAGYVSMAGAAGKR